MIFKLDCEYNDIEKELTQNEKVNSYLNGKKIKKIIFVKNKIINIVF
jgi:leucyl-tRNA synthetase